MQVILLLAGVWTRFCTRNQPAEQEGVFMHGTKADCCLLDSPASPVSHDAVLGAARLQRQNPVANWSWQRPLQ